MEQHDCVQKDRLDKDEDRIDNLREITFSLDKQIGQLIVSFTDLSKQITRHIQKMDESVKLFDAHREEATKEGGTRDRIKELEYSVKGKDGLETQVSVIKKGYWKVGLISGVIVGLFLKLSFLAIEKMLDLFVKLALFK